MRRAAYKSHVIPYRPYGLRVRSLKRLCIGPAVGTGHAPVFPLHIGGPGWESARTDLTHGCVLQQPHPLRPFSMRLPSLLPPLGLIHYLDSHVREAMLTVMSTFTQLTVTVQRVGSPGVSGIPA